MEWPVDCEPGRDCHVQNYVDRDPGPGIRDVACGPLSYDGHAGTDIRVATEAALAADPPAILAAAEGRVTALRDEMPDALMGTPGAPAAAQLARRECGNGVVLDHGGGWQTRYCHMERGSIAVAPGQVVEAGTPLGRMGRSGATEFPHLHFSLSRDGTAVDPFAGDPEAACGDTRSSLWADPPAYRPGGFLDSGISDRVPDYAEIRRGLPGRPAGDVTDPALVAWAFGYGFLPGDALRFVMTGPAGGIFDRTVLLESGHAQAFRAFGRRTPPGGWMPGLYRSRVEWRRDGRIHDSREVELRLITGPARPSP
ncbi:M23 family metallopeptidase [Mangrovicoccus algicola]|uniref:M23 family metallopeptidase n=1 Tax=Mangrovicoccus algicola TaxID=2771008 RepID=A0A8J6YWI3_9RHOB|nr:M23 family metallopeptidase [Mangrovicoccus algicola]MBE3637549.1 M23 family metallopeptidase [Mangrovicoccus algicola]